MANPGRPRNVAPEIDKLRNDLAQDRHETVRQTLEKFGLNALDSDGRTALINAVIENKPGMVAWLTDNGADVNHRDRIGYSALHFAAQEKLVAIAAHLLEKGADPNLPDRHGNTPLWTAVFNARPQASEQGVIALLLKGGANPDHVNKYGKTPRFLYQATHGQDISTMATLP